MPARMSVFAAGSEILRMVRDSRGYESSPDNGDHCGFDVGADLEAIEAICARDAERVGDAVVSVAKEEIGGGCSNDSWTSRWCPST